VLRPEMPFVDPIKALRASDLNRVIKSRGETAGADALRRREPGALRSGKSLGAVSNGREHARGSPHYRGEIARIGLVGSELSVPE